MNDRIIGQRVYDAEGNDLGTIKEVQDNQLKVDASMQPDYWLDRDRLRTVAGRLVVTDAAESYNTPAERDTARISGSSARGDTGGEARRDVHDHSRMGVEHERLEDEGEESIRLREERLRVGTERESAGEVHVGKRVVERTETAEVPVREERVVVERHPMNEPATRDVDLHNETIHVPVERERAVAEKETVVTDEVSVRKDVTERSQPVDANLHKEELVIENEGDLTEVGRNRNAPREAEDRYGTARRD